jgi:hypothetical protein
MQEEARTSALQAISDEAIKEATESTVAEGVTLLSSQEPTGAAASDKAAASVPRVAPTPPTSDDLHAAFLHEAQALQEPPTPSAMALRLLAASPASPGTVHRLFAAAFAAMRDREWLVVSLPFDVPLPKAVQHFDCLQPRMGSTFPYKLYLIHRCACMGVMHGSHAWESWPTLLASCQFVSCHGFPSWP